MSKSDAKASAERAETRPVLEFLYNDARRIGSILSQLNPHGHLQETKTSESAGTSTSEKESFGGKGGVPGVANLQASGEQSNTSQESEASEQKYDPLWRNALRFIDVAQERVAAGQDGLTAPLGSLLQFSAWISILDTALFKAILQNSSLKKAARASMKPAMAQGKAGQPSEIDLALELLPMMPHGLQAHYIAEGFNAWSSLRAEDLTVSSGDLQMKHGTLLEGKWTVLGILDAKPVRRSEEHPPENLIAEGMTRSIAQLINALRPMMGRPATSCGIMPLLIYRDISQPKE